MYALVCDLVPKELSYCNRLSLEVRVVFPQLGDPFKCNQPRGLMKVSSIGWSQWISRTKKVEDESPLLFGLMI